MSVPLDICRVCLKNEEDINTEFKSMDTSRLKHQTYTEIYEICTKYKIENDVYNFPIRICEECEEELLQCYTFIQKCVTAEIWLLRKFLEEELVKEESNEAASNKLKTTHATEKESLKFDIVSVRIENNKDLGTIDTPIFEIKIPSSVIEDNVSEELSSIERPIPTNDNLSTEVLFIDEKFIESNDEIEEEDYDLPQASDDENIQNSDDYDTLETTPTSNTTVDREVTQPEVPKIMRKFRTPFRGLEKKKRSNNKTPALCPICGRTIATYLLRVHIANHENKDGRKKYPCTLCNKMYRNQNFLRIHTRNHYNIKHYKCEFCEESFSHWNTKNSHVVTYHTGAAKFECSLCLAQFVVKQKYNAHMRQHTGAPIEKKFQCPKCDKRFDSQYNLNKHAVVHTGERNYKCDFCDKSYKQRYSLKMHIGTNHAGEKNYECPICHEAFAHNSTLRNHCQKNHPDYVLPASGTVVNKKSRERLAETLKKRVIYNPFYNNLLEGKTVLNTFATKRQQIDETDISELDME